MDTNFTLVKKGYDPQEVDVYIATLEDVIKSYKEKDMTIKNAIISAQIAADNIVKNAEIESEFKKIKAKEDILSIQKSLQRERTKLKEFKDDYKSLIKKYVIDFDESDLLKLFGKLTDIEEDISKESSKASLDRNVSEETKEVPVVSSN